MSGWSSQSGKTGARLIVLDPLQAYLGCDVDMYRANEVRPVIKRLCFMADRTGCAVILIGHMNKAQGLKASYRGLGSIDFRAAARSVLLVGRLKDNPSIRIVAHDYGIRFIAVNNNVDSLYGDNDFTPFMNLFNDFYAKDTSRKIRAVKKAQAERGERVATRAPYGYKKDENDPKRKIIPDEDAAPVVQRIFSLCAGGKGPSQIARQLKKEQILTPGNYYYHKTGVLLTGVDTTRPYDWSNTTVASILEDEVYLGHTISLQSTTISYKNKKRIERPKAEQLRFELIFYFYSL